MLNYYLCMDEDGQRRLIALDSRQVHDPVALLQGMNRIRCHKCFTYEPFNHVFMATNPPIYPTSPLIPTLVYENQNDLKIPYLCSHNLIDIATAVKIVIAKHSEVMKLPKLQLDGLRLSFPDDAGTINEFFKDFTLAYAAERPDVHSFMKLIESCNYNFYKIQMTGFSDLTVHRRNYNRTFTMYDNTLYTRCVTIDILSLLDKNRRLTHLTIEDLREFVECKHCNVLTKPSLITHLHIDTFTVHSFFRYSTNRNIIDFLSVFSNSLQELTLTDEMSISILEDIFKINQPWPALRKVNLNIYAREDFVKLIPTNRCNFPVLTSVNFIGKQHTYEPNPRLIDRLTGQTYEAYKEELYFFLVYNRRNYIAAHCWEVIAKNYLARPYNISPDIRRMIFKMVLEADTSKLGYVEPTISLTAPEVFQLKRIKNDANLPKDLIYCLGPNTLKRWTKIKTMTRKSEQHQNRRLELQKELDEQDDLINEIYGEAEEKIKKFKARIRADAQENVERLEKKGDLKRKRIETLEGYEKKIKTSLEELLN